MNSTRCRFIPDEGDVCPGTVSKCSKILNKEDCLNEGGTIFSLFFQVQPEGKIK